MSGVVKILFLTANPQQTTQLQLDEEIRAIDLALQQARHRDHFEIEQHWAVRATELQAHLLRHQPNIVHFSGHGEASNQLLLVDDTGAPHPVTVQALSHLFARLKDNIQCVVLNACFSMEQAQAIAQHIAVVIGMSNAVGDEAAIKFSAAFYQALAYGRSVQDAFQLGCGQIELANLPDVDSPQLFALRDDPSQLFFVKAGPPRRAGRVHGDLRNRQAMLRLVEEFWVEGVLQQSLPGGNLLPTTIALRPDAVQPGLWEMAQQLPGRQTLLLPPDSQISLIFEEMQRSLLILGEPGVGKTTLLLELARDRLAWANQDEAEPIPVVFNLAAWASQRLPLARWLVEELRTKYRIPAKIGQPWVENDELLLLLDGLDQVKPDDQAACVAEINRFCDHHKVALALCCRSTEYAALAARLGLYGAIVVQPLTPAQVQHYLAASGATGTRLSQIIQGDELLQRLSQTPLMLHIMTVALADIRSTEATRPHGVEDYRRIIFNHYIEQMFARRGADQRYSTAQAIGWLAWLAQNLRQQGQVEFLIEQLQPTWLPLRWERYLYEAGIRLITALAVLVVCLVAGLLIALVNPNVALTRGLIGGGITGIFVLCPFLLASGLIRRLNAWLTVAISGGLITALGVVLLGDASAGVVLGLLIGLPAALAGVLFGANSRITLLDKLTWNWRRAGWGAALGASIGLITSLIGQNQGDGPIVGLLISSALLPILGLTRSTEIPLLQRPNQGIKQSIRNALLTAALTLLACFGTGLLWGIFYAPKISAGFAAGLLLGLPLSLITGLVYGGSASLQHLILRLLLRRRGYLPWQCAEFLDFAAARILLRKVGGSYLFAYTLLHEHFAQLVAEYPTTIRQ